MLYCSGLIPIHVKGSLVTRLTLATGTAEREAAVEMRGHKPASKCVTRFATLTAAQVPMRRRSQGQICVTLAPNAPRIVRVTFNARADFTGAEFRGETSLADSRFIEASFPAEPCRRVVPASSHTLPRYVDITVFLGSLRGVHPPHGEFCKL